jgi:hypothetical protein
MTEQKRQPIAPGVYTESVRLFRSGEEYTGHIVRRLILGANGQAFARIDQPGDFPGQWENMDLASAWSDTGKLQMGDAVVRLHDNCGTHFMIPTTAVPAATLPADETALTRLFDRASARSST